MFEAKMGQASVMKKIVDAMKDLLNEASFDCSENSVALQAMDSSHVALVCLKLESAGFETYRCDRTTNLGINLANLAKIIKCAGHDDTLCLRFQDDADTMALLFENTAQDRSSEYELKLMDLDAEHLGIPEQDYNCVVRMPSSEFKRICSDLAQFGDCISICCTKGGVTFSTKGDNTNGRISIAPNANIDDPDRKVEIDLRETVNINFAVKYLNQFTKATPLSPVVTLSISDGIPIVVEYKISQASYEEDEDVKEEKGKGGRRKATGPMEEFGSIKYYLAPKVDENDGMD